jgi:large subunit ribosomal protein L13Ae
MNTNPVRGVKHYRSPGKMLWRAIRGMCPYKTHRGGQALARLKTFEGVPEEFNNVKRVVVPNALKVLHSKTFRKTTQLGRLCHEVGWKHRELVKKLEAARIAKGKTYYMEKKEKAKKLAAAAALVTNFDSVLAGFGYYVAPTAVGAMKALKAEFKSNLEAEVVAAVPEVEVSEPVAAADAPKAKGKGGKADY